MEYLARVFISYSGDETWVRDELLTHLGVFATTGRAKFVFDRKDILPDDQRDKAITALIDNADIALLLLTPSFLAKPYCICTELPLIIKRLQEKYLIVLPIHYRACAWQEVSLLEQLSPTPDIRVALSDRIDRDIAWKEVCAKFDECLSRAAASKKAPPILRTEKNIPAPLIPAFDEAAKAVNGRREGTIIIHDVSGNEGYRYDEHFDVSPYIQYWRALRLDPSVTHLPTLLESERGLPISDMYVELAVCPHGIAPDPELISRRATLADELDARTNRRYARRLDPLNAIDKSQGRHFVVLGDPGSGKSSLLKRICLDILKGEWKRYTLPLLIPLRSYWELKQKFGISLLDYAGGLITAAERGQRPVLTETLMSDENFRQRASVLGNWLAYLSGANGRHLILLLDGLDEIARFSDAQAALHDEITHISYALDWIITSRRAGFFGGLMEDERFEVVDLDPDSSAELIQNWFKHHPEVKYRASRIEQQILNDPRLSIMASNPFLLTLLCYLGATGEERLPTNRATIYWKVFELALVQAAERASEIHDQQNDIMECLSRFCLYLHRDAPKAPLHFFKEMDWKKRQLQETKGCSFQSQIVPIRLIDSWGITKNADYYLSHLTLYEYLVANALRHEPVDAVLDHIYKAEWRVIIRFYASMLWLDGREKDFATLIHAFLEPADICGLLRQEVAAILLEAKLETGLESLSDEFDLDFREQLWGDFLKGTPYISDAAAQAISMISPDWAYQRVATELEMMSDKELPKLTKETVQGSMMKFNVNYLANLLPGRAHIKLLGYLGTDDAITLLIRIMHEENQTNALTAAEALAQALDKHNRERVVELEAWQSFGTIAFKALCRLTKITGHPDFSSILTNAINQKMQDAVMIDLLDALKATADRRAAPTLIDFLEKPGISNQIRLSAHEALAATRADEARNYFEKEAASSDPLRVRTAEFSLVEADFMPFDTLAEAIRSEPHDQALAFIELVEDAADRNRIIAPAVISAIASRIDEEMLEHVPLQCLARCLTAQKKQNNQLVGLAKLANALKYTCDGTLPQWQKDAMPSVIVALRDIDYERFASQIELLALNAQIPPSIRGAAIQSLGQSLRRKGEKAEAIAARLMELLNDENITFRTAALAALAENDPMRLLGLSRSDVRDELARISAETGQLFFKDFMINESGQRVEAVG